MTEPNLHFNKIAVLIDGDNFSSKTIESNLQQINAMGVIGCKKVYGDFKQGTLAIWNDIALKLLLEQVHVPAYVKGKNTTDIALAIDAIDLAYDGYDCFCILSSDSDFSVLAKNLRTKNKKVYGFGKDKAVESFRLACDDFFVVESTTLVNNQIVVEAVNQQTTNEPKTVLPSASTIAIPNQVPITKPIDKLPKEKLRQDTSLMNALRQTFSQSSKDKDYWVNFANFSSNFKQQFPNIDIAKHGYSKLHELIDVIDIFDKNLVDSTFLVRLKGVPKVTGTSTRYTPIQLKSEKLLIDAIHSILANNSNSDNGFSSISHVGSQLKQQQIDLQKYGYNKLSELIKALALFEIKHINNQAFIKVKSQKQLPPLTNKLLLADIVDIISNNTSHQDGWTHIGHLGSQLKLKGHDAKLYGYKTFSQLIENVREVTVKKDGSNIQIKLK